MSPSMRGPFHGDELLLTFARPAQAAGTRRRAFLFADVFYSIEHAVQGVSTRALDPLPFHGTTACPYALRAWPYRRDAAYARYRRAWNTRRVERP